MKTLADGTQVTSRSYYFLLDFNDVDQWKTMHDLCNKKVKLHDLNKEEYISLFKKAVEVEIKFINKQ
jgi:hypothetical protein